MHGYVRTHERTFAASSGSDACTICSIIFHCLLMSFSIWGWRVFWAQFELELCVYIHSIPFYWTVEKYSTYASQIFDAGRTTDFEPWSNFVFKSNLTRKFLELRIHPGPRSRLGGPSSWLPWQSRVQSPNSTWIGTTLTFGLNGQSLSFLFRWTFCWLSFQKSLLSSSFSQSSFVLKDRRFQPGALMHFVFTLDCLFCLSATFTFYQF